MEHRCAQHPECRADAVCAHCHALACWRGVAYDAETDAFLCGGCREAAERIRRRQRRWRVLRLPSTYVIVVVLAAGLAYAAGIGNRSPARLARSDEGKLWYAQDLPLAWVEQASRTRKRAAALEQLREPRAAASWAQVAEGGFARAATLWAGTPVERDLRLAATQMTAKAGQPREAVAAGERLAATVPENSPDRPVFLYQLGRLRLAAGDRSGAASAWSAALDAIPEEKAEATLTTVLDGMLSQYADLHVEALVRSRIRTVCETDAPLWQVKARIEAAARDAEVTLAPARRPASDGIESTPAPPPAPAAPKPGGGLVIEKF